MRSARGSGSVRQRRPGVWEVRVALGPDPVSGRSRRRSITVHGDADDAAARARWADAAGLLRLDPRLRPAITVDELLAQWLAADHGWRPATRTGYRSTVGFLRRDRLATRRATDVSPSVLRAACGAWRAAGVPEPTVCARVRVLRSALGHAYAEGIIDRFPLAGTRGPRQAGARLHAPVDSIRAIIRQATADVAAASDAHDGTPASGRRLHRAQQVLLLVRLAADTGARRGELACLQVDDLDGDVLTIARAASCEVVGPTKTGRIRRITLGATTAELWRSSVASWQRGEWRAGRTTTGTVLPVSSSFGPWLFSHRPGHGTRLTTSCAGHWFADLAHRAGHGDVTLHRLRHTVATVLVAQGDVLQAQQRLGHRDASTTLRIYSHALPLTDADAAAKLDRLYR